MLQVLGASWALLLAMMLLQVGNGVQGTIQGIRGALEGFSTWQMSLIMSGYFAGFLGGSLIAPRLIRRGGHLRVFAALGSLVSAVLILYPSLADPWVWLVLRVAIGFCFSGVYVTAESWLNNSASNDMRGQTLSLYVIVQLLGIVAALLVAYGTWRATRCAGHGPGSLCPGRRSGAARGRRIADQAGVIGSNVRNNHKNTCTVLNIL